MASFSGSITTTGRSEAIRLDKALFKAHPEFRQKAKVRADVIGRGKILISVVDETEPSEFDEDPVVSAFLSFLERDLQTRPDRIRPLSETLIAEAVALTEGVSANEDEDEIPDDVSL